MLPKYNFNLLTLLIVLSFPFQLIAQSDNSKTKADIKLSTNFSGRYLSGTFTQLAYSAGINGSYTLNKWSISNRFSYRFNETNTLKIEDNFYDLLLIKYTFKQGNSFYAGGFYHFDNNLIFRVNHRHRFGVGPGYYWKNEKGLMFDVVGVIGYELANFGGTEFVNTDLKESQRNSPQIFASITNGFHLFKKKLKFTHDVLMMVSLNETADYDIWYRPKLSYNIAKSFSINLSYDYRFENVHLKDLSNYNDILMAGVKWQILN